MKPGKELLFLALGGSGEIGMNVNLYGCDGKWIMVDLGMTFADPAYPGVELVLPDLTFIEERRDDLLGVVLTHGHEDHIGAIPYLADDLGVPLWATPFTAGLIREKLQEEGLERQVKVNIIDIGGTMQIGPFGFRFVPLAHSIPEGNALLIDTPYGKIFHTGDWKLDEFPQLGDPADAAALTRVGDEGILALVCDSTNVFQEEASGSEEQVRLGLDRVIGEAEGRVLVTTFASNAARLSTLGKVAQDTGRQVCVAGRSLDRILRVARSVGYLTDFPETIDFETAMSLPRRDVMIIGTGGQGENRAALARIAFDQHRIKLSEGDLVVFSSKQIPGNEIAIGRIQNELAARGIRMITDRQANVHVSGHPGRPELAAMYGWIRPEIIVPVHGEMRHMAEHERFARSHGVPKGILQKNGDVILAADGPTMNERRKIASFGVISVALALNAQDRLVGDVQIALEGIPVEEDREAFLEEACEAASEAALKGAAGEERLREAVRLAVRRCATEWTGKKPVVDVLLIRV
ncbi:ribonuclease J [Allosphingosinicella sp.]|uniref:ribonuclease J n=1 Tax=Allosphingosinicella sp. TaxID=2823234 RepID=UPI002F0ED642